jgi:TctA family transporter
MDLNILSTSLYDYLPYLFSVTLGVIFGTISGLLPGVGHLLALTLSSPFLIKLLIQEWQILLIESKLVIMICQTNI